VPVITCHVEAGKLGLASNHADVLHWFKRYNKTMDDVRNDVVKLLGTKEEPKKEEPKKDTNVIQLGDVNDNVKTLQLGLIKLGYSCGPDGADGDFGPNTLAAVKKFQKD
jgi:peptidoglycan hydrolase-like protein with peptidoglycan-binding domain